MTALNDHILTALSKCSTLCHLKQLQAHLHAISHGQTQLFAFKLLRFCSITLADLRHARLLFDSLDSPNIYLYTAMITAYSSDCDPLPALRLFGQMLRRGRPEPNEFIYPHVLKCCCHVEDKGLVAAVHGRIVKTGFEGYGVVKTPLVDGYSKCGELEIARKLFDELSERNVVSWTTMVSAYMRVGLVGNAICMFEEMPDRDIPAWNAAIAGCTQNGFFSEAAGFFRRMVYAGTQANQTTVSCILSACGHLGMVKLGKSIHSYIYKNRIGSSTFVSNALVDMYGKCGSLKEAKWVFDVSSDRSLTAWNSLINCLALHGRSNDAISVFNQMEASGPRADAVTFVGLLNACTHGGLVEEGRSYFNSMTANYGIEPRIEHYGCIIDLLGRAGRFEEVMDIINNMRIEPDEVVWGSLLNGCRIHGNTEFAELAVKKLLEIDPTSTDYGVMLANLYSECGRWEEVGTVRKFMKETGRKKLPGCSWIELDGEVYQFYSGDKSHPNTEEIRELLEGLSWLL